MQAIILNILVLFGCFFVLVAAFGVLRFPDFFTRMHASAKAGAFGGSILAIATAVAFGNGDAIIQALMIVAFFYITTPVATHLITRVAYMREASSNTIKIN